jgi:very-short-patch-repair endonuclease
VAGLSAARLWNLDLPSKTLASPVVQLDVPNRWWRGACHPRIEVFRRLKLTPADLTVREGVPCTTLQRTLVDIAGLLSPISLEVALDSARRREPRILDWLGRLLARLGTQGRKGAGVLRRLVAERRHLRQDSAVEVRLLRPLLDAGEKPQCNVPIRHRGRHVATVDFLLPRGNLVIFTHGFAFHSDRPQWERDMLQVRQLQRLGYRVLCFSASDVRNDLKGCVKDILDALAAAAPR